MKKIALLLTFSFALLATVSVSAKTNDSHYDFYGKAGPTIEKNYAEKMNVKANEVFQITQEACPDVGIVSIAENDGNVISVGSHYAEPGYFDYYIASPQRMQPDLYRQYPGKRLNHRSNDVIKPPGLRLLLLT